MSSATSLPCSTSMRMADFVELSFQRVLVAVCDGADCGTGSVVSVV